MNRVMGGLGLGLVLACSSNSNPCPSCPDASLDGTMDGPAVNDAGNDSSKNDAANDGAVDAGWTPKNLAELVLWTESSAVDVSDAGTCPTWPDQSPVGNTLHA